MQTGCEVRHRAKGTDRQTGCEVRRRSRGPTGRQVVKSDVDLGDRQADRL